jgi:fatty-acyl-CoA synthase
VRQPAVSHGFADLYLHGATLVALAPAFMVAVGVIAPRLGLMSEGVGVGLVAMEWAPHVALASVAAGFFGVLVAMLAGFSQFWLRALMVLVITTTTLFAYVWDREVRQPAAEAQMTLR